MLARLLSRPAAALILTIVTGAVCNAQTGRDIVLAWTDTVNPATTVYDVKRGKDTSATASTSPCSSVTPSTVVNTTAAAVKTYRDVNPGPGVWCYTVVAWDGVNTNLKSADSNKAFAVMKYAAPTLDPLTVAFVIDGMKATVTYAMSAPPATGLIPAPKGAGLDVRAEVK